MGISIESTALGTNRSSTTGSDIDLTTLSVVTEHDRLG